MQIKVITAILTIVALANGYATYCKCQCGTDYEIFTLADDESCKQCNAEYCLGKRGTLCSGKSDEEAKKEIVTMCFGKYEMMISMNYRY